METIIFNFAPLQGGHLAVVLPNPGFQLVVPMPFHVFINFVEEYLNRHSYSYLPMENGKKGCVLEGENVRVVWRVCKRIGLVDPLDTRVPITLVHVE